MIEGALSTIHHPLGEKSSSQPVEEIVAVQRLSARILRESPTIASKMTLENWHICGCNMIMKTGCDLYAHPCVRRTIHQSLPSKDNTAARYPA